MKNVEEIFYWQEERDAVGTWRQFADDVAWLTGGNKTKTKIFSENKIREISIDTNFHPLKLCSLSLSTVDTRHELFEVEVNPISGTRRRVWWRIIDGPMEDCQVLIAINCRREQTSRKVSESRENLIDDWNNFEAIPELYWSNSPASFKNNLTTSLRTKKNYSLNENQFTFPRSIKSSNQIEFINRKLRRGNERFSYLWSF